MKKSMRKASEQKPLQAANFLAVLGLAAEMARCLNENLPKLDLEPLKSALPVLDTTQATQSGSL